MNGAAVEVKICGLTNLEDALLALECGADYLGFVLYARSVRGITAAALAGIVGKLPAGTRSIGVFVNEPPECVAQVAADCGLFAVQVHGEEQAAAFAGAGRPVWRAVALGGAGAARPDPAAWPAARYVLDAAVPGLYGGTGVTADWNEAARLAARYPVMLAGGLTAANVAAAVRVVGPLGVDVASGVEAAPGRKDPLKVEAFVKAAKRGMV